MRPLFHLPLLSPSSFPSAPPFLRILTSVFRLVWHGADVEARVYLHATDQSALGNGITMENLKKFAAEQEAQSGGGSLENAQPVTPGVKGGIAKEV